MPFSQQQIDDVLARAESENLTLFAFHHLLKSTDFRQHPTILGIVDYLTGRASQLPVVQYDASVYVVNVFLHLLENIETPSVNDHLILDLVTAPALDAYMQYAFHQFLLGYLIKNDTDSAIQHAIYWMKKTRGSEEDIFKGCIFYLGFDDKTSKPIFASQSIQRYVVDYIKQSKLFISPFDHRGLLVAINDETFSKANQMKAFFVLLDDIRPEFAERFVEYLLLRKMEDGIKFVSVFRNGIYLQRVQSRLQADGVKYGDERFDDFTKALTLYELDSKKYRDAMLFQSRSYLDYYLGLPKNEPYGSQYYANSPLLSGLTHFSTFSLYIVFENDRSEGLAYLEKIKEAKAFIQDQTLTVIAHYLNEDALPYYQLALQSDGGIDYYRSVLAGLAKHFPIESQLPLYWSFVKHKSKPLRAQVASLIVANDSKAEEKAIELLNNKSADARQTAAQILSAFSSPAAENAIKQALGKETNDVARDILLQTIAGSLPGQSSYAVVSEMVDSARERGKLNKSVEAWLIEDELPSLHYESGSEVSKEELRFLLYRMSRVKDMRSDIEAKYLLQLIDRVTAAPFALTLIKLFIEKGAKPEHKYLMTLAGLLGDDTVVDKIRITTDKWIDENRYKMAEYGVGALAIQGSNKALRWVEWYSRKYKAKRANVGSAALAALETAAEELNITTHELGDRIVPDFGFDGLFKHFAVNGENYRAFIDNKFKIAFFNDDNKKLKTIPAAADDTIKEEFKSIAKEVRDITKSQSSRLEYYLVIQRKWSFAQWRRAFLENPVMFIYATRLLWGVYDEAGNLQQAFYCNEDTSLQDASYDDIEPGDNARIGIVHPTQLPTEDLQRWKQHFYDTSVDAIFPQLERLVVSLNEDELTKTISSKYDGKLMKTGSIRSTLEKHGWHKGSTGDGGYIESFKLLYDEKNIEAVLEIEGVSVVYGFGGDEKLGKLYVLNRAITNNSKWYSPKGMDDEALVAFKELPPIFLNEMFASIDAIKVFESN
ncbi:DUF4132 domain-containing protein [Pinibacter soli]|uniref:DUF4132 domain-containing protein n=1 Tax=Pinibacter soli TaxID=3044211 RepID=A0ABT6REN1_9BACT|nr:DUF4132 domain-containing protein [Pinibacter soli]MDI3321033.1 DUF4132 domain-containing protein [Pinibacter soli]